MKKPIIFRLSSMFRVPFSSSPFLLFALSPFLLYSCKTTKHIETVKTEYKTNHIRDSIHCYDSVYIKDKGDTIFLERYKYLYQDRIVRDSIFINDTIRIPVPSGLRSSASGLRFSGWQNFQIWCGRIALIAALLTVIYALRKKR